MTSPTSTEFNPYSSARPFFGNKPVYTVSTEDTERVQAYEVYERMYWNDPGVFKLIDRTEDGEETPIYLPSGKKIIEACNRFLAVDWNFVVDTRFGTPEQQNDVNLLLTNLFRREMMWTKFGTQKRYGLIKGDTFWHITADPTKNQGQRISIHELDPASVFPIYEDDNLDRVVGYHIVDLIPDPRDSTKQVARRQTYRKQDNGRITSELKAFEVLAWDDRNLEPDDIKEVPWDKAVDEFELSPAITSLPVYHIKNNRIPGHPFGYSEIRGIETVLKAVNQSVTDEDLALAMAGLGVYATDAAPPQDTEGEDDSFEMGPARMFEVGPGEKVWRVSGVPTVAPMVEHMNFMMGEVQQGTGTPDIAIGKVDVSIAESGISLALQLAPILAKNEEKEGEMLGVYDHMLYDLVTMWFVGYEDLPAETAARVSVATIVGNPLPENRDAVIQEVIQLISTEPPLITIEMAQERLAKLGYDFSDTAASDVITLAARLAAARGNSDPFANRWKQELEGEGEATGAA